MEKVPYREPGSRVREAYELTPAGRELSVVLGALQGWGDRHLPRPEGPSVLRRSREDGRPVRVAFVDEDGCEVPPEAVELIPNPALRPAAGPPRA